MEQNYVQFVGPALHLAMKEYKTQQITTISGYTEVSLRSNERSIIEEVMSLNFIKDYFQKCINDLLPICPQALQPCLAIVMRSHIDFCSQLGLVYGKYRAIFDIFGQTLSELGNYSANECKKALMVIQQHVQSVPLLEVKPYNEAIQNLFQGLGDLAGFKNHTTTLGALQKEEKKLYDIECDLQAVIKCHEFTKIEKIQLEKDHLNVESLLKFYRSRTAFLEKEIVNWQQKANEAKLKEERGEASYASNSVFFWNSCRIFIRKKNIVDTSWEQHRCTTEIDMMQNEMNNLTEKIRLCTTNASRLLGNNAAELTNFERQRQLLQNNYDENLRLVKDRRLEVRRLTYAVAGLDPSNQQKLAQTIRFMVNGVSHFTVTLNFIKGYAEQFTKMFDDTCSQPGLIQSLDFAKVISRAACIGDVLQSNSVHFLTDENNRRISSSHMQLLNTVAVSPDLHSAPPEVKIILEKTKKEYEENKDIQLRPLW